MRWGRAGQWHWGHGLWRTPLHVSGCQGGVPRWPSTVTLPRGMTPAIIVVFPFPSPFPHRFLLFITSRVLHAPPLLVHPAAEGNLPMSFQFRSPPASIRFGSRHAKPSRWATPSHVVPPVCYLASPRTSPRPGAAFDTWLYPPAHRQASATWQLPLSALRYERPIPIVCFPNRQAWWSIARFLSPPALHPRPLSAAHALLLRSQ